MNTPEQDMAQKNQILKFLSGSHAYGTNGPSSDKDYIAVFVPNEEYLLGNRKCESVEFRTNPSASGRQNTKDDVDLVSYALPKYIRMLGANNPTLLETLYYPDRCLLFNSDFGREVLINRDLFVSQKIEDTFLGYALSQKHLLLNKKNRWESLKVAQESIDSLITTGVTYLPVKLTVAIDSEKIWYEFEKGQPISEIKLKIEQLLGAYGHRLDMVKKYGFDLKFAANLPRLMYECLELMTNGTIVFPLKDASIILDIKQGKYTLPQVLELSDYLKSLIQNASLLHKLPNRPDLAKIEALQIKLLKKYMYGLV